MPDSVPKPTSSTGATPRTPAKIGRYEVVERLGSGSTGTVYRALDPFIGRVLAIKTFRVDLEPGPHRDRFLQRFYHEARISGGLAHPNIVALFDVGEVDGLPYLVFEHVEGPTLDVALARAGRLDSTETIRIVEQTAAALDFAHSRGVVHRDIRPANIILAEDKRVRIADFGIARVEGSQLTQHGEVLGTPAYMSPEQIRGHELSPASDLFSLAVCAYEMLSGQRPFVGKSQQDLLEALVYSPPEEPKELRMLGIPSRDFMFVFERALAKDPSHRFADGASFGRALKSCLGVVGGEALPVPKIEVPPESPVAATRPMLPAVAPPPPAPVSLMDTSATAEVPAPPELVAELPSPASAVSELPSPMPSAFDTSATAEIEGAIIKTAETPAAPTARTETGFDGAPSSSDAESTLMETVGFGELNARDLPSLTEATMVSPGRRSESGPPSALQTTLPDAEASGSAGMEAPLPPTRDLPRLKVPPAPPARVADPLEGATMVGDRANWSGQIPPADKTVIMTESERSSAARQRIPDRPPAPERPAPPVVPYPVRGQTGPISRPGLPSSPSASRAPAPRSLQSYAAIPEASASAPPGLAPFALPRTSVAPKILIAGIVLVALLALGIAGILWGRAGGAASADDLWNGLQVYPESEVEKSPLLYSHELPRPNLEPGRVVSITVSWIVTPEGTVDDPRIVTSASPEIDAFVIEAVRKWRYEPGQKDGRTVPVRVLRKYTFPLSTAPSS